MIAKIDQLFSVKHRLRQGETFGNVQPILSNWTQECGIMDRKK